MEMNEVRRCASGWVQHAAAKFASMIDEPGHSTGPRDPLKEEPTMLKTISAALLAVSVLAAPALAAGQAKTTNAPVTKAEAKQVKPNVLNANAKMAHHQHTRHHRAHKHMGALKTHQSSKVSIKHAGPAVKRG
jgi:hypothetical protein